VAEVDRVTADAALDVYCGTDRPSHGDRVFSVAATRAWNGDVIGVSSDFPETTVYFPS